MSKAGLHIAACGRLGHESQQTASSDARRGSCIQRNEHDNQIRRSYGRWTKTFGIMMQYDSTIGEYSLNVNNHSLDPQSSRANARHSFWLHCSHQWSWKPPIHPLWTPWLCRHNWFSLFLELPLSIACRHYRAVCSAGVVLPFLNLSIDCARSLPL